jgi:hypothetical protein
LLNAVVGKYPAIVGRPLSKPLMLEAILAWSRELYLTKASRLLIDASLQQRAES